jgi:RNA polymerase sigma-32 factor
MPGPEPDTAGADQDTEETDENESIDESEVEEAPVRKLPKNLPALGAPPASVRKGSKKDLLSYYLAEVRRHPLLSREEEHEWAVKFVEEGDQEAAERLVTANLRLVIKIAFQYHRQWANVLDLIQEGNVGLVEALSRYDPYRDIRFSSYAQYWIRAMILRFLLDNFRLVRLGSTRAGRKLFFQLQKERDRLLEEGKLATPEALAERLGVKPKDVTDVDQHMRAPALSLHAPAGDEADGRTLSEIVPEKNPNSPEENAAKSELGSIVQEKLAAFAQDLRDDRERRIWSERLVSTDPSSLSVLGAEFGVSKERVRQLEARIKKRLKAYLEAELGDEIDFEFST